ncbi:pentatricopeptide repeat-containing protein At2g34400-like [Selaginella moellendorffii]|uniref:pentatricopeptide repeat-containing protein At2g34400-like n=1 Tax=Selaginella moellendorffii TaxID=88036 RepID=UPI000D1CD88C|nr:pentatricopeptide repeat-containing protein At2g34400-like [Selaginella moellendorffii]|eukprot:XP_024523255.1 pentatricopeptide repeat-containing protein At2g34400-like [Selaginella moellendorffii]
MTFGCCWEEGKVIHGHILESGLNAHLDVAAAIVNMYGKLGRLDLAMEVYDRVEEKKLAAWNTAIAANAHNGQFGAAIALLWKLDLEGIRPDMVTLIEILAACSWKQDKAQGIKIHERICSCGWERNVVAGTSIVNMYGKCARFKEAKRVFYQMHVRDVVTWNAMISALAHTWHCREAINLYKKMGVQRNSSSFMSGLGACAFLGSLQDGKQIHAEIIARFASLSHRFLETGVDNVTYVNALHACAGLGWIVQGRDLHSRIAASEWSSDAVVMNSVMSMFVRCGSPGEAKRVFLGLKNRSAVSWTIAIAASAQQGSSAARTWSCSWGWSKKAWPRIPTHSQGFSSHAAMEGFSTPDGAVDAAGFWRGSGSRALRLPDRSSGSRGGDRIKPKSSSSPCSSLRMIFLGRLPCLLGDHCGAARD